MRTLRAVLLSLSWIVALPALAADASGTWSGEVKLPNGQSVPFVAHLKQDGATVTGTLAGINGAPDVHITAGTADHDTITFTGVRPINGADVEFHYTGHLQGSDAMHVDIVRADGKGMPLGTDLKRAAP